MTKTPNPIDTIDSPSPTVPADDVCRLVKEQYGLNGRLTPLASYRDQLFRLTSSDEYRYIVRIANADEEGANSEFQAQALQHITRQKCAVVVPRVIPTQEGSLATTISSGEETHIVRLVSYVPGRPLDDVAVDARLAGNLGRCLAELDISLRGFEHSADSPVLLWDMQRASGLRSLLPHVVDYGLRDMIRHCFDEFEKNVLPAFESLRHQVIHGDLNPGNVLVADDGDAAIVGVIDFGDMVRAPLIVDVAIGASYLRAYGENPLAQIAPFVAGYDEVTTLYDAEIGLLYDLVRTRLCTSITMMYWHMSARAEGDACQHKSLQDEQDAGRFLALINSMTRTDFVDRIQQARGR